MAIKVGNYKGLYSFVESNKDLIVEFLNKIPHKSFMGYEIGESFRIDKRNYYGESFEVLTTDLDDPYASCQGHCFITVEDNLTCTNTRIFEKNVSDYILKLYQMESRDKKIQQLLNT